MPSRGRWVENLTGLPYIYIKKNTVWGRGSACAHVAAARSTFVLAVRVPTRAAARSTFFPTSILTPLYSPCLVSPQTPRFRAAGDSNYKISFGHDGDPHPLMWALNPGYLRGRTHSIIPPLSRTGLTPGEGVAPPNLQDRKRVPPWRCACSVRAFWRITYHIRRFGETRHYLRVCGECSNGRFGLREVHFGQVGNCVLRS